MLKYFDILMGVEFFQDPRENLISLIIKKKKKILRKFNPERIGMIGAITPKMENMIEKLGFSKKKKKRIDTSMQYPDEPML